MVQSFRCHCGAEYVVEEGSRVPPSCRFCGGTGFSQVVRRRPLGSDPPGSAPPESWRQTGPLVLDRFELGRAGGRRAVVWGSLLLLAFLLPRPAGDDLVFGWQLLLDPGAAAGTRLLLALTLVGGGLGMLLGIAAPLTLRGLLLLPLGAAPFLLGWGAGAGLPGDGAYRALALGAAAFLGLTGGAVRTPRTAVARLSNLLAGLLLLLVLALLHGGRGAGLWSQAPFGRFRELLLAGAGAGGLAALSSLSDRICLSLGRLAFWLVSGCVLYVAGASFGLEGAPDPFFHLEVVLTWGGFFSLSANGLADLVVSLAVRLQEIRDERTRREELGFLERFNRKAVFGSGRRRR